MLNFGNKEFRNLQEQVLKNAQDIETLKGREDLQIVIVNELPEVGNPNYIYLVAKDDGESPDVYDEYIWLEDEERYEKIGGVTIDLTNYVTTDTEQTITGAKALGFNVFPSTNNRFDLGSSDAKWKDLYTAGRIYLGDGIVANSESDINFYVGTVQYYRMTAKMFRPMDNNLRDLGSSDAKWKDLYLGGSANIGNIKIYTTGAGANILEDTAFYNDLYVGIGLIPKTSNNKSLGSSTNYWKDLYLAGNISDGANTVSVSNIASKVTSTFISGTFDSNGESTIDTEQAGTPEGLFIFTYGNCQCFLRLTATMVNSADTAPIRVACPMIYNSDTVNGWLNITKSGYILILKVTDGTNHVDSGYAWTLTKTNLI